MIIKNSYFVRVFFLFAYNVLVGGIMEILITNDFANCLFISILISIITMTLVQKFKELPFVNEKYHIFFLNLIFSFAIGISVSIIFFGVKIYFSIWISIFSFIGASNIYELLRKQEIINYTPFSLSEKDNKKNNDLN